MFADPFVHQRIARAAVEPENLAGWREVGDVGDPADVDDCSGGIALAEESSVKRRHQWGTFTAGSDVPATEVADDRNASEFGEQCAVAELYGKTGGRIMADGLAMTSDGRDPFRSETGVGEQRNYALRVSQAEPVCGEGTAMDLVGSGLQKGREVGAKRGFEWLESGSNDDLGAIEVRHYRVDAVQARARHETDVEVAGHTYSRSYRSGKIGARLARGLA